MLGTFDEELIIGNLVTLGTNELSGVSLPTFTTAHEYMQAQFDLVDQFSAKPGCRPQGAGHAARTVFSLYSLRELFTTLIPDDQKHGRPFAFHHANLRLGKIIANEGLGNSSSPGLGILPPSVCWLLSVPPSCGNGQRL